MGSSFGAGMGLLLMQWLPDWNIQPGLYAMCAAAAMLGGVFRSSISLVVIVVEGTQASPLTGYTDCSALVSGCTQSGARPHSKAVESQAALPYL